MRLAKPHLDVGLFTNQRDAQLRFWQSEVGLEFDHVAKLGGGVHQLRHYMNGSILKINHTRSPLANDPPQPGWRELLVARAGVERPTDLVDPDGNRVSLVPPGHDGVVGIGIRVAAADPARSLHFYQAAFDAAIEGPSCRIGDSVLRFEPAARSASPDGRGAKGPTYQGLGYRYVTVQVFDCDAEYEQILSCGATVGQPPQTIGTTTRYAFVLDSDGNWIELSERGELVGGLRARSGV